MEIPVSFANRNAIINALTNNNKDYYAFSTHRLFDGNDREYIVIPEYLAWYAKRSNGTYRLIRLDGITQE